MFPKIVSPNYDFLASDWRARAPNAESEDGLVAALASRASETQTQRQVLSGPAHAASMHAWQAADGGT